MSACGDGPTGVRGCAQPEAVWVEFTDADGLDMAAVLCHEHAARLRAGEAIWDGGEWERLPYAVTSWRSSAVTR
jgi:hypothetical protein